MKTCVGTIKTRYSPTPGKCPKKATSPSGLYCWHHNPENQYYMSEVTAGIHAERRLLGDVARMSKTDGRLAIEVVRRPKPSEQGAIIDAFRAALATCDRAVLVAQVAP